VAAVAVVGSLSLDRISGGRATIGGGAYHAARALRLVAGRAHVLTRCGDGERSFLVPRIAAVGVPAHVLHGERTTAFSISYTGDHRTMTVEVVGDPWRAQDVARLERRLRWVQVAPLLRSDFDVAVLAEIARGRTVLLDGQGLVRVSEVGSLSLDDAFDRRVLEHVSILKLSEEEAEVVGDVDVPEVLLTRGARGATVRAAGRTFDVPAHPLARDPTGAGDAFSAVYLASRADGYGAFGAARRATSAVAALL
jgi:sugar/nucleoside kinase (ribokinase family)